MICTNVDSETGCPCSIEPTHIIKGDNHMCLGDEEHYPHEWNYTWSQGKHIREKDSGR